MMGFTVKRILNHTYVAVPSAGGEGNSYDRNVLAANRIPGLLDCRVEHMDGKTMLLYDVTSRQSLRVYLEKRRVSAEILRTILGGILRAAENLEEYLLDPGHFVLKMEYVFLDAAAEETGLIYDTGYEGDFYEGLKELAGGLLANVPEDDHEAILLGYRFCHELDVPARDTPALLGLLAGNGRKEAEYEADPGSPDLYVPFPEASGNLYEEPSRALPEPIREAAPENAKKRRRTGVLYAAAVTGGGLAIVLLIYTVRTILPAYRGEVLPLWLSAVPAAGIAAAFAILMLHRRRKKPAKEERSLPDTAVMNEQELFRDLYVPADCENPPAAGLYVRPEEYDGGPETQILSAPAGRSGRTARLVPKDTAYGGAEIRLAGAETRIGKLPEAVDAVIASPVISRIHARVMRRENGWFLEDLNSRNGTYVNGKNTAPGGTPLADGDEVRFADEGFIFRIQ